MSQHHAISFGTAGWRGIIADDFTMAGVRCCARALADELTAQGKMGGLVLVGYDSRFMGRTFARHAAAVLQAAGYDVGLSPQPVTTPVLGHAVVREKALAGVCFTASHNPPEYQGFKIIDHWGGLMGTDMTNSIAARANKLQAFDIPLDDTPVAALDMLSPYIDSLANLLGAPERRLNILVDPMYGPSASVLPAVLRKLGHNVTTTRDTFDPLFGGIQPDPRPESLEPTSLKLANGHYDLGLATDADGDRFGILDATGELLSPNDVLALLIEEVARRGGAPKGVGMGLVAASLVRKAAKNCGFEVLETPVGFKHLGRLIADGKSCCGVEESSGFAWGAHLPDKDGALACGLFAALCARTGKSPAALRADLYDRLGQGAFTRLDLRLSESHKNRLMDSLKTTPPTAMGSLAVTGVNRMDGVKLELPGAFMAFRASGTEPLVRVYIDAPDKGVLGALEAAARAFVDAA